MEVQALRQHRDACSFQRSHQRGLLQQLSQVAVEVGIPADCGLQRQPVDLWVDGGGIEAKPATSARAVPRVRRTIDAQPEQTNDPRAPIIQLARRMGIRVDDAGGRSDALQPDRLPHQQHFLMGRPIDNDQVARLGRVDRSLDRARGGDVGWSLAADRDRHGVD